jgi:hypothetical protein
MWSEFLAVSSCRFGDRSWVILQSSAVKRLLRDA